jgi:hypothetical protein
MTLTPVVRDGAAERRRADHAHIFADWDAEAGVWTATSDDVPGLAIEAETLDC